jgi:predicted acetyltransferase
MVPTSRPALIAKKGADVVWPIVVGQMRGRATGFLAWQPIWSLMQLVLIDVAEEDKAVMRRLVELYRYDFSAFDGADVGVHGEFGYRYFDCYWTDPGRHPFLLRLDDHWAGFAMVREGRPHDMAEFFVMKKDRRHGIGRQAATELFARFPGRWALRQQSFNPDATAFWRAVIPPPFSERRVGEEVVQEFDSVG